MTGTVNYDRFKVFDVRADFSVLDGINILDLSDQEYFNQESDCTEAFFI